MRSHGYETLRTQTTTRVSRVRQREGTQKTTEHTNQRGIGDSREMKNTIAAVPTRSRTRTWWWWWWWWWWQCIVCARRCRERQRQHRRRRCVTGAGRRVSRRRCNSRVTVGSCRSVHVTVSPATLEEGSVDGTLQHLGQRTREATVTTSAIACTHVAYARDAP